MRYPAHCTQLYLTTAPAPEAAQQQQPHLRREALRVLTALAAVQTAAVRAELLLQKDSELSSLEGALDQARLSRRRRMSRTHTHARVRSAQ
jgi:hypothetical protein